MSVETPESTTTLAALQASVAQVMDVQDTTLGKIDEFFARFRGQLKIDSQVAYAQVAEQFKPLGFTPLFRRAGQVHVVLAMKGVIEPRPSRAWINALLFGLTIITTLWFGSFYDIGNRYPNLGEQDLLPALGLSFIELWQGWPFALSLLAILGAHEMGHYVMARYHKVPVTWPYFIPLPPFLTVLGTMGAVIVQKAPPTNRRVLLDVGIAGPLAGLVVAIPVVIIGLMLSPVRSFSGQEGMSFEGNSILYVFLKYLVFGQFLPTPANADGLPLALTILRFYLVGIFPQGGGIDVSLNQVAWAGWGGLLVTSLNLIPAGQLDGGHALYVLIGDRAKRLVPVIIVILLGLGIIWQGWWLWAALIFFLGQTYAEPLDQITELDPVRRALAISGLVLFVLVFMPVPLVPYIPPAP